MSEGRIQRQPLREIVYARLLELIVSGQLAPLEVIREDEVADWLAVSRHPVREAIAQLESNGFVDTRLGSSPRVSRNNPRDAAVRERLALSVLLISVEANLSGVKNVDVDAMRRQRQIFANALKSGKVEAMITALVAFDDTVVAGAEAPPLLEAFRDRLAPHLLRPIDDVTGIWQGHRTWRGLDYMDRMICAFDERDPEAAVAALEAERVDLVKSLQSMPNGQHTDPP